MKKNESHIVLGLGFGDEGKGLRTSNLVGQALTKSQKPLVIRFSGGHQAGHTVKVGDTRHVFSSFGSGTLQGTPTYWSAYCPFSPNSLIVEAKRLTEKGVAPKLYVDKLAPVTTPFDVLLNRLKEEINNHGSCGAGINETIHRNTTPYKLYAKDLEFPYVVKEKLKSIEFYYINQVREILDSRAFSADLRTRYLSDILGGDVSEKFIEACNKINGFDITMIDFHSIKSNFDCFIFEGSQGILLDEEIGFFPNVTRGRTCSKNAIQFISGHNLPTPTVHYVTRAYQTRHGNGPMSKEGVEINLTNNADETNVLNRYQGSFKVAPMDMDLINYAITSDKAYSVGFPSTLTITCLDQVSDDYLVQLKPQIASLTHLFKEVLGSYSPDSSLTVFGA